MLMYHGNDSWPNHKLYALTKQLTVIQTRIRELKWAIQQFDNG